MDVTPSLSRSTSYASALAEPAPENPRAPAASQQRSGWVGGVIGGALGTGAGLSMGATGVAQTYKAAGLALPGSVAALAACGTGWGPLLRAALDGASQATVSVVGPWSLYVTRFPNKLADLYACMAVNFESALAARRPGQPYPPDCVELPLPNCPNPNAYRTADIAAPWVYAMVYTGVCLGLAGAIGVATWRRFGPQNIIGRLEDALAQGDPEKTCVANLVATCDPCGLVKATEVAVNRGVINFAKQRIEARPAPSTQPLTQELLADPADNEAI